MVVKGLIESAMSAGKTVTDNQPQLQQFLTMMEYTLTHRLKCASWLPCRGIRLPYMVVGAWPCVKILAPVEVMQALQYEGCTCSFNSSEALLPVLD